MKVQYEISVKRIIDTAPTGKEPDPQEVVLAEFTGGADEAAAVLASLAERVKSGKKIVGWASFVQALSKQVEEHNAKAKAEGKPTFGEALRDLFEDKPTTKR
jgi:crotonobetainyl-CoA:carnitine CoA-transferase CaiB-like acyl-CoA transferase